MNYGFEELRSHGSVGVGVFWSHILLICISISVVIFSLYWLIITSSSIWMKAVSGSMLTVNLFLMIFGLVSASIGVMQKFGISLLEEGILHQLFIAASFGCQLMCCILMALSRESKAALYVKDVNDFCVRNPTNTHVINFLKEHSTEYAVESYVAKRTTRAYNSIAAFFGIWLPTSIIYLFLYYLLNRKTSGETKDINTAPLSPLRPNRNEKQPPNSPGGYSMIDESDAAKQEA